MSGASSREESLAPVSAVVRVGEPMVGADAESNLCRVVSQVLFLRGSARSATLLALHVARDVLHYEPVIRVGEDGQRLSHREIDDLSTIINQSLNRPRSSSLSLYSLGTYLKRVSYAPYTAE